MSIIYKKVAVLFSLLTIFTTNVYSVEISWLLSQTWKVKDSGFLEEFYKVHPDIKVNLEQFPINGVYEQIQVRVGTCQRDPDVVIVNAPFTASYGLKGWLVPLDDVFITPSKVTNK